MANRAYNSGKYPFCQALFAPFSKKFGGEPEKVRLRERRLCDLYLLYLVAGEEFEPTTDRL